MSPFSDCNSFCWRFPHPAASPVTTFEICIKCCARSRSWRRLSSWPTVFLKTSPRNGQTLKQCKYIYIYMCIRISIYLSIYLYACVYIYILGNAINYQNGYRHSMVHGFQRTMIWGATKRKEKDTCLLHNVGLLEWLTLTGSAERGNDREVGGTWRLWIVNWWWVYL